MLLLYLLELSVLAETVRSTNNNRDTSLSIRVFVNKHCCPLKCFIRLNFFFSCLDCLSRSLRSYRFSSCYFQSYMNRVSGYLKCRVYQMNMELRSKMQTKHNILRPLPTSSNTWQLALQVWTQLGKIQKWVSTTQHFIYTIYTLYFEYIFFCLIQIYRFNCYFCTIYILFTLEFLFV